ncbi:MAG: methyltransferase domain-containing protein [Cyanobacteria bacterium J06632_22]
MIPNRPKASADALNPAHSSTTSPLTKASLGPRYGVAGVSAMMTDTRCPICQHPSKRLFQKQGFWLRECRYCGHRFAEATTTSTHADDCFGDDYFLGAPGGYRDYLAQARQLRHQGRRYGMLLANYMSPGRVLAVGAGAGFVLKGLTDVGWAPMGIEPNAGMVEYGQRELGLPLQQGTLEQFSTVQVSGLPLSYDLVTFIQVLPQFYNLDQALNNARQVTKPRGYWLVEICDRTSRTARLQGQRWSAYQPPTALHWFSPEGVIQLARQYGFRPIAQGTPQKWTSTGAVKASLRARLPAPLRPMVRLIPSGWPLPCWSEGMTWLLLQKLP